MTLEGYPNPPDQFAVITGEEHFIEEEKNNFFEAVLDYVGYDQKARESFAEILPMILHRYDNHGQVRPTDDRVTLLIIRDRVVASVLERRNDANWVEAAFACYLKPEIVGKLRKGLRVINGAFKRDDSSNG